MGRKKNTGVYGRRRKNALGLNLENMKNRNYNASPEEYKREDAYLRAQKKLKEIKGFYWHALWYVLVNIFIIVMIAVNTNGSIWHFGTFSTPLFLGNWFGLSCYGCIW